MLGHCWPVLSGSTRSQSPPSVRRISSGFRQGSLSGRMRKRSKVSAKITFISVMANVCPMQFLQAGVVALTTPWTFIPASPSRKSGPQPPPPSAETEKPNNAWDPRHGFAHPLGLVQISVVNADAGGKGLSAYCRPLLGPTSIPKTFICPSRAGEGRKARTLTIFIFPTSLPDSHAWNLSPRCCHPHHCIPTSNAQCPHLGPAEKGIKAKGDLPLMFSGSKRKGS